MKWNSEVSLAHRLGKALSTSHTIKPCKGKGKGKGRGKHRYKDKGRVRVSPTMDKANTGPNSV